jgi:hypothetical protein
MQRSTRGSCRDRGPELTPERAGISTLIEVNGRKLLTDAGRGALQNLYLSRITQRGDAGPSVRGLQPTTSYNEKLCCASQQIWPSMAKARQFKMLAGVGRRADDNATLAHREAVRADAFFALGRARPLRLRSRLALQSRRHE